jgi:hypothetical protein
MNRKGISFTLTLVVIGVVLLMTALTVIVVGGGEITNLFNILGESSLSASVSEECSKLADSINRNYCSHYASGDGTDACTDVRANPSTNYETPVNQIPCNWQDQMEADNNILSGIDTEVTVQGNAYDCLEENEMTPTCPA